MKTMKYLGCLLALIFAGASAFAETVTNAEWFQNVVVNPLPEGWSGAAFTWKENVAFLNDWSTGATYTPVSGKSLENAEATYTTTVKFTAMDIEDIATQEVPEGAKAGLTVVETSADTYTYYGIVIDGGVQCWRPLAGAVATVEDPVTVKVALYKDANNQNTVKYSIVGTSGDTLLTYASSAEIAIAGDATISSVQYLGQCELSVLSAMAWAKSQPGQKNDSINLAGSDKIPTSVAFNREDLRSRGVDPDDATAITTYLTTKQTGTGKNGQYGWVNVELGIADDVIVGVQSNICAQGSVTVDFGLATPTDATLTYAVDDKAGSTISTTESDVHVVTATIKKGDAEVVIAEQLVGVMNTGKENKPETGSTYDIVSVPWDGFDGQQITVANLFNTKELNEGDKLHVPNGDAYVTFRFDGQKWVGPATAKVYSLSGTSNLTTDPETCTLEAGTAVWVEHNVASKLVLTGLGNLAEKNEIVVGAGWTLVANPTVHAFALTSGLGKNGDEIVVEDAADPAQYKKDGEVWKKWVETTESRKIGERVITSKKTVLTALDEGNYSIPAGVGFWYVNNGTNPENVTISFGPTVAPKGDQ